MSSFIRRIFPTLASNRTGETTNAQPIKSTTPTDERIFTIAKQIIVNKVVHSLEMEFPLKKIPVEKIEQLAEKLFTTNEDNKKDGLDDLQQNERLKTVIGQIFANESLDNTGAKDRFLSTLFENGGVLAKKFVSPLSDPFKTYLVDKIQLLDTPRYKNNTRLSFQLEQELWGLLFQPLEPSIDFLSKKHPRCQNDQNSLEVFQFEQAMRKN